MNKFFIGRIFQPQVAKTVVEVVANVAAEAVIMGGLLKSLGAMNMPHTIV